MGLRNTICNNAVYHMKTFLTIFTLIIFSLMIYVFCPHIRPNLTYLERTLEKLKLSHLIPEKCFSSRCQFSYSTSATYADNVSVIIAITIIINMSPFVPSYSN